MGRVGNGVGDGGGKRATTDAEKVNDSGGGLECNGSRQATDGRDERRSRGKWRDDETRQGEGEGVALVKLYAEAAAAAGPGVTSPSHRPSHGRLFFFMGGFPVVDSCRVIIRSLVSGSVLFSLAPCLGLYEPLASHLLSRTAQHVDPGMVVVVRRVDWRDEVCVCKSGMHHFILGVVPARGPLKRGIGEL